MTTAPQRPIPGLAGAHDRRRTIAFLFAALSIGAMLASSSALTPFYPPLEHSLDITPLGVSLVFAIYAVTLLAALLVAGSLSDHVGRRSVISIGLVTLAVGALTVSAVDTAPALFAARALQGTASGLLTPALSALLLDTASPLRPGRGALLNAIMPGIGLALGTLAGGAALTLITPALPVTFRVLAGLYLALAAVIWLLPETSPRRTGSIRSLIPRVSIPRPVRRLFLISTPALIASWATGGLFLSLGPSIIAESLHTDNSFAQGAIVALLPAAGAVAVVALRRLTPRAIAIIGTSSLAIGTAIALVALGAGSLLGYILAVVITGAGFGVSFYGVVGTLAPRSPVEERAGLFAAIYVTSYLSFGVPTVAAGFLASATSIPMTAAVYGILITALAATAAIARIRASD
ncbi:MFS transporter [Microbacterium sp. MPKO10]|uniref:MFS transporter n=1 Tax=Microbacterium sp. MPKO10 TaxID=2989818 RepID=UPI0022364000|nr:MFS transporter [Microbacterium sp. MPKO10]MCW4458768.1 MFS transporter [Microbacterium sp. MPKO10]